MEQQTILSNRVISLALEAICSHFRKRSLLFRSEYHEVVSNFSVSGKINFSGLLRRMNNQLLSWMKRKIYFV